MRVATFVVFALFVHFGKNEKLRYDGYKVYRILPKTYHELQMLKKLEQDFDFWKSASYVNRNVDIMVPPYKDGGFQEILQDLDGKIMIEDVQKLVDSERGIRKNPEEFGWDDYHTLEEINEWLSNLTEIYFDTVTLQQGGVSYEGRPIVGVKISFSPDNANRSVFIEGNIHACEWISSAVVTYTLNQILTNPDPEIRQIVETHDWYIFPAVNPDGFAYTHTKDRIWRKTRVPYENGCYGADPNRNWDYHFNEGGASDDPCDYKYAGPEAFSEPEMKSLSEYIATIGGNLVGYFSFHSYAQILLLPYGYTTEHLDNYDELYDIGLKAITKLAERYGTEYQIGNVAEILYVASGGSPDWIKGNFAPRISYTYELRDTGEFGFLLPAAQIIPTAEETFDSFITIFQEFAKN